MTKSRLIGKIKDFEGRVSSQKKKADRFYAKWKESNDPDNYRQSQYYYKECEKSKEILKTYKEKLKIGDYE